MQFIFGKKKLKSNENDNTKAAIYGFIVGDALGVPVEFLSREVLKSNPIEDMKGYGTYNQPKGTWSDDTSMILATIDGLLKSDRVDVDYKMIMSKFLDWMENAEYTPFDDVFDIGNSTRSALTVYKQHVDSNKSDDILCGDGSINSNGNGSLMRILPIALYLYYSKIEYNSEKFLEIIKIISSMTHSHMYSILGCYIYTVYLIELLKGNNKNDAYLNMQKVLKKLDFQEIKEVYSRIIYEDISKLKEKDIKSTGYVVDTLEAVMWCVLTSNNFKETVLKAVNLGSDTDTIGALAGGLAGCIYGYYSIPKNWIDCLQKRDYIDKLIEKFYKYLNSIC